MRRLSGICLGLALLARASGAEAAPAPAFDPPVTAPQEVAILSGGCFWGMQGVFEHVKGVRQVLAGYTGGAADTAQYEMVSTGSTGHAESVRIVFDPHVISYGKLLQIFVTVAADPTQLNYQGPDQGTQYRSEIWYAPADQQQQIAQAYLAQLTQAKTFPAPIVVRLDPAKPFYPAESYHQDFLVLHPDNPYIAYNDLPKLQALQAQFPQFYLAQPVRVTAGAVGD
ncbi:MAG TPA: peptide-methionine (S)-S-oxide reductase MsrA [Acidocella sp.]|jgi:peptide-methionine (S)-S-oxide reductase|nr:peptide-methionine (S)-S-oxide reductase MsrA [Acidocella sp.]